MNRELEKIRIAEEKAKDLLEEARITTQKEKDGKIPRWVFMIVIGIALSLISMDWTNTVKSMNDVDKILSERLNAQSSYIADLNVLIKTNIVEVNGRLSNIEKALGVKSFRELPK